VPQLRPDGSLCKDLLFSLGLYNTLTDKQQSRECTEPKDWSKVECRNCGEKGHGAGRCKNPAKQDDASTGGVDIADAGAPSGGWEDTAGAGATATGGWDSAPTPAPSGAVGAW